ncbi:SDR family oxidoreductase [Streptomyces sp. NPDC048057]|uniref:SDR family oxidoreductase n=1 Tax=Streptomyces sp. NPDC048057 TaxID=3155628 RepID=UPI0033CCCB54
MPVSPTVLLTGASGVVGTALLHELTHCHVIALVHRTPCPGADESVVGDLTGTRFGLDAAAYARLAARVDVVVHCAAITSFSAGPAATHRLNEAGTGEVLRFTEAADAVLHHVSTAFVARRELTRTGAASGDATARPEDYLDSKRAGEEAVRASGVPAVIVRPSVVIGDSTTGRIATFQGMHGIVHALLRELLPLVPVPADSRVDFVPQDVVARSIAALIAEGRRDGEAWITAGAAAPTAQRVLELTGKVAADLGVPMRIPRTVGPDMVDRLIRPVFISALHPRARRTFDDLLAMTALFAGADAFPSTLGHTPASVAALTPGGIESAYEASVRHIARARGLVRTARAAEVAPR